MQPQNATIKTAQELCSARPRTGESNATFGCTEATISSSQCFHVHSINASVGLIPDEATSATWYHQRNQQYSITAVTTSSGSVAERYAYTAYGQPTILDGSGSVLSSSAINNRYTYTGREWDATLGLYHFRARWMSGLAGRFMGREPIGYWVGVDLYINYMGTANTDPSGERIIERIVTISSFRFLRASYDEASELCIGEFSEEQILIYAFAGEAPLRITASYPWPRGGAASNCWKYPFRSGYSLLHSTSLLTRREHISSQSTFYEEGVSLEADSSPSSAQRTDSLKDLGMAQTVRILMLFVISCSSFATAGDLFPLKYNSKLVFRHKHGEVFVVKAISDPVYSTSVVHFSITKLNTVTELIVELREQEANGPYPVLAKQDIETRYLRVASTKDLVSEIEFCDHLIFWSPGNENMGWLDFGMTEKSMTVCCIDKLPIGFTERDLQFLSISDFTRKNEARISQETVTIRTINAKRENGKK